MSGLGIKCDTHAKCAEKGEESLCLVWNWTTLLTATVTRVSQFLTPVNGQHTPLPFIANTIYLTCLIYVS